MKLSLNLLRGGLLVLFVSLTALVSAQSTVSGTITDADSGDPLIGASVLVTGTSTGTVTDFDGNFTLNVPANAESLTVSYTGYATQVLPLDGRTTFDVSLASGELLDEVVVVGYGSVKKDDLTGAVVALTEEDFNAGVITSPEELIQGRAPGVQITQTSGEPGAAVNFRIRGTSSVRANNNPLFVIDGVPLPSEDVTAQGAVGDLGTSAARNPLNFLNPADIAEINVLKDASATAIYGSRGANGVVIINTKKGSGAGGGLSYGTSVALSNISKRFDLLGRDEFLRAYQDINGFSSVPDGFDQGADTDWQDEIFRTALTHQHNLGFGGGDDQANYRFSVSYMDQEGIVEESGLERVTARFNGSRTFLNDRLRISTQFTVANVTDDNVPITQNAGAGGDLLGAVLKSRPTNPVFNEDGTPFQPDDNTEFSPVALLEYYESQTRTLRGLANVSAELDIVEGLTFKTVYGADRASSSRYDAFSPLLNIQGNTGQGRLTNDDIIVDNTLWENYFTYDRDLGATRFTGLLGYSYQKFDRFRKFNAYTGFRRDDLDVIINNQAAAQAASPGNSSRAVNELQSYFGRVNFDINDRFLLTATLRADGSTRFGENFRYGYFPSFAFKWRLLEEAWVPDAFSTLGLRLGYGITGNQEFGNNLFISTQRFSDGNFQNGGLGVDIGNPTFNGLQNDDFKWESTSQINAGLDFGFSNNRVSGSVDYYRKNTSDLLFQTFAAQPAPNPFQFENLDADIINEGVELALNVVAVDQEAFGWDVGFNIGYNNNVVQNFSGLVNTGQINGQGLTGAFAQRIANGQPLYAFFLRPFGGFDSEGQSIYPEGDVQQFVDASPLPTVTAGLNNRLYFGNFDLNVFLNGQFGHHIYSNTANAYFTAGSLANGRNVTTDVVTSGEGRLNAPDVSTRFLEKGDFVRLQNATLGWNVPVNSGVLSTLRLSLTGQNLFVITNYSGQDPEVSIDKAIDGIPSAGIDSNAYPRARTFILGLNAFF